MRRVWFGRPATALDMTGATMRRIVSMIQQTARRTTGKKMDSQLATYPSEVEGRRRIAREVAGLYRQFVPASAIFSSGSTALGDADAGSDVDIGIYFTALIPAESLRKEWLSGFADAPEAISFGKFGDTDGCERFSVRGIHVFVGWWSFQEEMRRTREKLESLLDKLDDAAAEWELGEIQRLLVLHDPDHSVPQVQGLVSEWFRTGKKQALISERLGRAEYNVTHDLPRALLKNDLVWAEDLRHCLLNDLIRTVYYLNNRFLRRLKGVDLELSRFSTKPCGFVQRIREAAVLRVTEATDVLHELLRDVRSCQQPAPK